MDGDLSQDDNGNFSVELNGRDYPIASVRFAVLTKKGYFGLNGYSEAAQADSISVDVGDVEVMIDAPSAESIGKRFVNKSYDSTQREEIADLFKLLNHVDNPPDKVYGSLQDSRDFKADMLEIKTKGEISGSCSFCNEKTYDSCTICGKNLCTKHDISAGRDRPPIRFGYCEDCLYYLNLIETVRDSNSK